MNIFRTATKQAIRDIIEDNASTGRYGLLINEANVESISERIVDLFEMTLSLRAQVSGVASAPQSTGQKKPPTRTSTLEHFATSEKRDYESASFPKTRWAAEIYDTDQMLPKITNPAPEKDLPVQMDLKLPRKRIGLTQEELDKLGK